MTWRKPTRVDAKAVVGFRDRLDGSFKLDVMDKRGRLIHKSGPVANLWTDNWREWQAALWRDGTADVNASLTDKTGTSRLVRAWSESTVPTSGRAFTVAGDRGARLSIGDGAGAAVTPARGDTALVGELARSLPLNPSNAAGTIAWSNAFVNGSGGTWTVREGGFEVGHPDTAGTGHDFLLMHVATQPTNVNDGQTVTATYTLTIP